VARRSPPRPIETVFAWSGGRRIHLLTWSEIGERRRTAVEHVASRIVDVDDLEGALSRIFRRPVQRRIPGRTTPEIWFEIGR